LKERQIEINQDQEKNRSENSMGDTTQIHSLFLYLTSSRYFSFLKLAFLLFLI